MPPERNGASSIIAAFVEGLIKAFVEPLAAVFLAILKALFGVSLFERNDAQPVWVATPSGNLVYDDDVSELSLKDVLGAVIIVFGAAGRSYDEWRQQTDSEVHDEKLANVLASAPKVLREEYDDCVKQAGSKFIKGDDESLRELSNSLVVTQEDVLKPLYAVLEKPFEVRKVDEVASYYSEEQLDDSELRNQSQSQEMSSPTPLYGVFTFTKTWQQIRKLWGGAETEPETSSQQKAGVPSGGAAAAPSLNTQKLHRSCTSTISTILRTLGNLKGRLSWEISLRTLPPEVKGPTDNHSIAPSTTSSDRGPQTDVVKHSKLSRLFHRSYRKVDSAVDYWYEKLSDPLSIRLFQIESSSKVIRCELKQFRLSSAPAYNALSYTWGRSTSFVLILCNDKRLIVSQSLHDALRRLAKFQSSNPLKRKLWFWVDQICINQQDHVERARQVRLMRLIYEKSQQTLVWLGTDDDASARSAFRLINDIYEACISELQRHERLGDRPLPGSLTAADRKDFDLPPAGDAQWHALVKVLDRAWFTRVWCVQEVAVALHSPTLLYGSEECSWRRFAWATYWLHQKNTSDIPGHYLEPVASTFNLSYHVSEVWELVSLLQITRTFQSTDPRDKIYGLLGLSSETRNFDRWPRALQPDYMRATVDVFRNVTRYCIEQSKSLTILSEAQGVTEYDSAWDEIMPSWVPQFDEPRPFPLLGFYDIEKSPNGFLTQRPRFYDASGGAVATLGEEQDLSLLVLRGVYIDRVKQCTFAKSSKLSELQSTKISDYTPMLKLWASCKDTLPDLNEDMIARMLYVTTTAGLNANLLRSSEDLLCHMYSTLHQELTNNPFASVSVKDITSLNYFAERAAGGNTDFHLKGLKTGHGRKFFITESGFVGLGPPTLQIGDAIVVLLGGDLPFVLRQADDHGSSHWKLVGECFVHDLMDGEALSPSADGRRDDRWFKII